MPAPARMTAERPLPRAAGFDALPASARAEVFFGIAGLKLEPQSPCKPGLHPKGVAPLDVRSVDRRGQKAQDGDDGDDEGAEDRFQPDVALKPPEDRLGLSAGS